MVLSVALLRDYRGTEIVLSIDTDSPTAELEKQFIAPSVWKAWNSAGGIAHY